MEIVERVERIYMNNTKIANQIRKYSDLDQTLNQINVGRQGGEPIHVWYVIDQNLSAFDCMVADMIYTLRLSPGWDEEERIFTLKQLMCLFTGNPQKAMTAVWREDLQKSVERLCHTRLDICCTQELKQRDLSREDGGRIQGAFLGAVSLGRGRYRIPEEKGCMPLYEYASQVNRQMISFDSEYWNLQRRSAGEKLAATREAMMIRHYLIRRIELMRNPNNHYKAREIAYVRKGRTDGGMLPEIGIDFSDCHSKAAKRHKRQRIHGIVKQILEVYQGMGYIQGYEERLDEKGWENGVRIIISVE